MTPELLIVTIAAVACAIKSLIALNTFGTNDVIAFYQFGQSLSHQGLEKTYTSTIAFNHPPLVAHYLKFIYELSQRPALRESGITFPFLLRLPGILADFVSVLVLLRIRKTMPNLGLPFWALALFALSPVAIMVSGFHGNTDPIMVMFLLLGAYACARERPLVCGLFFALSFQIKIIPLLLLPILFFFWLHRRSLWRFLLPLICASLVLWSEPLLKFPTLFFHNVLSYGSFWGLWGITYFLNLTGWTEFGRVTYVNFTPAQMVVGTLLKLLIVAVVVAIGWRRRALPAPAVFGSVAYAWIVFFVFSPGVCAQYMVWLVPFVLLLSPMLYGYLELTSSLFLFFFYNAIADSFPWYVGISDGRHNADWIPWSIWPWAILIAGLITLWRGATRRDASLRLISLATVDPSIGQADLAGRRKPVDLDRVGLQPALRTVL